MKIEIYVLPVPEKSTESIHAAAERLRGRRV